MRNILVMVSLAVGAMVASAAPFLVSDPYPASGVQPDSASLTINGGSAVACTLEAVTGGARPKCDLASVTAPGTYTLVVTVTKAAGIVNGANTATNTVGSTASSTPFSYKLQTAAVPGPTLSVSP